MGRGVVGGPAVVGALRVLRVPLQVTGTEQALHCVPRFVLSEELRLAHAGAAAELVALVLRGGRRVVPVAGHLFRRLLDGVQGLPSLSPWSKGYIAPQGRRRVAARRVVVRRGSRFVGRGRGRLLLNLWAARSAESII